MKKIFISLLGMCLCVSAFAQKPVVVVDYFTTASCTAAGVSALRSQVIAGLSETNRVNLIDVETEASLTLEVGRRASELALEDQTARMGQMRVLGANYLISGVVSKMGADKKTMEDGKVYYTGNVVYSLKVVNAEDGTLIGAETYTYADLTGATGSTPEEATVNTLKKAQRSMEVFVSKYFKVEGTVVEMGEMKGGKPKNCYISLGSEDGIEKGQRCEVFAVKRIAGREARTMVGVVVVDEVVAADLADCKFVSGAKEIVDAFQAGQELVIVTKEKADILGKAGNVLGGIL